MQAYVLQIVVSILLEVVIGETVVKLIHYDKLDGKSCTQRVFETAASSDISCVTMCGMELTCLSSFYTPRSGLCIGCDSVYNDSDLNPLTNGPDSLYYKPYDCAESVALVTGSNGISDSQITTSSFYDDEFLPEFGRLDHASSWSAGFNDETEYIQFDFHSAKIVNTIITQGFNAIQYADDWVTSYKIRYSPDCETFTEYNQIFVGNTDPDNHVSNVISPPILARCVRIYAVTWHIWITMRIELMGC